MKIIGNNGAFMRVLVSSREVERFNSAWPCSSLSGRQVFEFYLHNMDLTDHLGKGNGQELIALTEDARGFVSAGKAVPRATL